MTLHCHISHRKQNRHSDNDFGIKIQNLRMLCWVSQDIVPNLWKVLQACRTLGTIYPTARHKISEDLNIQQQCCENLRSHDDFHFSSQFTDQKEQSTRCFLHFYCQLCSEKCDNIPHATRLFISVDLQHINYGKKKYPL